MIEQGVYSLLDTLDIEHLIELAGLSSLAELSGNKTSGKCLADRPDFSVKDGEGLPTLPDAE